jgi:RNase P protein component
MVQAKLWNSRLSRVLKAPRIVSAGNAVFVVTVDRNRTARRIRALFLSDAISQLVNELLKCDIELIGTAK